MLKNTLMRMIERGQTDGLREKIDTLYALGGLSEAYTAELIALLPDQEAHT